MRDQQETETVATFVLQLISRIYERRYSQLYRCERDLYSEWIDLGGEGESS